jgi:hypothetical protein
MTVPTGTPPRALSTSSKLLISTSLFVLFWRHKASITLLPSMVDFCDPLVDTTTFLSSPLSLQLSYRRGQIFRSFSTILLVSHCSEGHTPCTPILQVLFDVLPLVHRPSIHLSERHSFRHPSRYFHSLRHSSRHSSRHSLRHSLRHSFPSIALLFFQAFLDYSPTSQPMRCYFTAKRVAKKANTSSKAIPPVDALTTPSKGYTATTPSLV